METESSMFENTKIFYSLVLMIIAAAQGEGKIEFSSLLVCVGKAELTGETLRTVMTEVVSWQESPSECKAMRKYKFTK